MAKKVAKKAPAKALDFSQGGKISKVLIYLMLAVNVITVAYFLAFNPAETTVNNFTKFLSQFSSYLFLTILLIVIAEYFTKQINAKQMMMKLLSVFGLIVGIMLSYAIAQVVLGLIAVK
ncbi:MAG: hypothetical protein NTW50_00145 [Candidatus Berkelbacteria bacterium]|nr:hypothetical protein [Candidatus Berkelbacteria bacterium]